MRLVAVFRDKRDYTGKVLDYIEDLRRLNRLEVEKIDPDTSTGDEFAKTYGIVEYPTFLVISENDGRAVKMWSGAMLPLRDEIVYYTRDN